ncbi:hypothetical protein VPH209E381_0070 [Vibrio phage 209E38-1]
MISKLWRWLNSEDVLDNLSAGFFVLVGLVALVRYGF